MADETRIITDAKGRKLTIRELTIMDQVRMLRAIGPAQSGNQQYVQLVTMAMMVAEIDGVPQPIPRDERTIDAMITRLGDDGMQACMIEMMRNMEETRQAAEAAMEAGDKPQDPLGPSAT